MYKKTVFYIGCIITLMLPMIKGIDSFASGISLLLGMILASFHLISTPENIGKFRKLTLNSAVVLFGFGLSISKVISVGGKGIFQTAVSLIFVVSIGLILSKIFKMEKNISQLIIFGTAICGGSAIAATSPVIEASDEDIALSTGIVFVLNTVALFLFAFFINYFKLNAEQTGIWTALSIHDTSSVVSAASFHSTEALKIATIMKLTRTLWIIPIVLILSILNKSGSKNVKFPVFILFFILASIFASIFKFPEIYSLLTKLGKMLLALALYFIGTSLNIQTIKKMTGKNLIFGITLWIFSIISGYAIVMYI
ncbi:putative sulfate exporter family transporter [Leptotrichia sp. OH3620_COT-345]|uniref:YeiH family protein n=1 Tax=Leptotrichia sp. OH3620_COT-345 TaxID=2491048 RepID=UPI000F653B3A|nr:putative sulfate exporter family transporter [Leptotrichia sp. OH3620_COT-345]RRD38432.1 putative sulfate exporter family transporter [Leptotrichia sp. OH3620_COT-345]